MMYLLFKAAIKYVTKIRIYKTKKILYFEEIKVGNE